MQDSGTTLPRQGNQIISRRSDSSFFNNVEYITVLVKRKETLFI